LRHYRGEAIEGGTILLKQAGDHDLLLAARGDPEAFGELAERHLPRLRLWAYGQTRELATANDIAAETLARAWIKRSRYRGESDATARGWLFGIARNVVREWRRAQRVEAVALRRMGIELPPPVDDPAELDERLAAAQQGEQLWPMIDDLPPAQRDALKLRILEGLPYDQAAAQLGRSDLATRLLVSRALQRLRRAVAGSQA
jgi:RNA polymerase sigma-70 factor, ECF subfamily